MVGLLVYEKLSLPSLVQLVQNHTKLGLVSVFCEQARFELDDLLSWRDVRAPRPQHSDRKPLHGQAAATAGGLLVVLRASLGYVLVLPVVPPLVAMPSKFPRSVLGAQRVSSIVVAGLGVTARTEHDRVVERVRSAVSLLDDVMNNGTPPGHFVADATASA